MKLIIYISNYNLIGGVEKFVENFCKRMSKHYDVTLLFDMNVNINQLIEISKYVTVQKLIKSEKYKCDVFINSTSWGLEPFDYVIADKYIQVIHADYRHVIQNWNFKYKKHRKTTHHVAVGEIVKEAFEQVTPYKIDAIIYNLLDNTFKPKPKLKNSVLTLITASRLSGEKGFDRMKILAEVLQNKKIPYLWNVYGDISTDYQKQIVAKFKHLPSVKFHGIKVNPYEEINQADYLVQLSDTEGFCYSIYEALQFKTPCLITPFPSGNEQITNGKNGYILPFDMKNIDIDLIVNNIPKVKNFKEIGSEKAWINFI